MSDTPNHNSLARRTDYSTLQWALDALEALKQTEQRLATLQGGIGNLAGERDHWKQRAETAEAELRQLGPKLRRSIRKR